MDVHLTSYIRLCVSTRFLFPKQLCVLVFLKTSRSLLPQNHKDTKKGFPLLWYGESERAKQNACFLLLVLGPDLYSFGQKDQFLASKDCC